MIYLYSGTPGSGKSLHIADRIYWSIRTKKPVICNFDINEKMFKNDGYKKYFTFMENSRLTPKKLIQYAMEYWSGKPVKEDTILLVIDEAQLMFNAREWTKKGREEWISFFTQHRKFGYRIVLVAQFDRMLDRQLRSLIEYEYVHRKLKNYGWRGWFLSALMLSPHLFVCVKVWYPMKEKVGSEFFKFRKKLSRLYDSYATFSA